MEESPLRRIQFVTRHYAELRGGVKRAALAPILLALALVETGGFVQTGGLALALAGGFGYLGLSALLDQWMNRRFGRVMSGVTLNRVVILACVVTFFMTHRLDRQAIGTGNPSILFLAAAAYAVWLCVRLWPFAPQYFLPAVVAAGFAMLFGSVDTWEDFLFWERYAYVSTLLAWTVAGLFDCALLMRVLPRPSSQHVTADAPEEHADSV